MNTFSARKLVLLVPVLVASTSVVAAQSGRRGTPKPTTPPPAPSASDPKAGEAKPPENAKRLQLSVGMDDPSVFNNLPRYLTDTVVRACLQRLDEAGGVVATASVERMTRSDAIKAAKAEKEKYVVWLHFGNTAADSGRQVSNSSNELYVDYVVFEPSTAKVKSVGRTYNVTYKAGNVGVSGPTVRREIYLEYAVQEMGRKTAEKILASFGIKK